DGAMLGRAAYQNPAILINVDSRVFADEASVADRVAAVAAYIPYVEARLSEGVALHAMTRHMLGLFASQPGGRLWRRVLSEDGVRRGAGVEVVRKALTEVTRPWTPAL